MKIAESNIMYHSTASFQRTSDETIYNFDQNKMILEKKETQAKESRHTTAAAYYHNTNGDDVATLRYAPETLISNEITIKEQPETEQENEFDKNFHMASVFTWAADTFDKLVSAFEQEKVSLGNPANTAIGPEVLQPSFGNKTLNSTILSEQRIQVYREMASFLRTKAMALLPEAPLSSKNGLRKTLTSEQENLNVQAHGMIQTTDGREINFSLDVQMNRENMTQTTQTFLIDPLVINFESDFVELTDEKIYFDLDSDGTPEQISTLQQGSGFLALDMNNDGRINNGLELFGPSTGDGFRELSLFDSDNNNWIDENDPIYDDLRIWVQEDSQNGILKKLAEAGIGAIHLGSVDSQFTIKGTGDQTLGEVSQTGIALMENGKAKTIQQINLIV